MDRRAFLTGCAALATAPPEAAHPAFGRDRYDRAIVIDGLGNPDDPYAPVPRGRMSAGLAADLAAAKVAAFHVTLGAGSGEQEFAATVADIALNDQFIAANADRLIKANTAADIRRAKAEGRTAIIYGFQNATVFGEDLDRVALFGSLGVRIFQLCYNARTFLADGCLEPANAGLSKLGRRFIARLESERLLLDLSHAGQRTISESIAAATRPLLITHTGCRSLYDHPRNVWDVDLKALADKGGVVGIYWTQFLTPTNQVTGADVVQHMSHAVDVCGEDHVGIGTDGMLRVRAIDARFRAFQLKMYNDRTAQGIAAPGERPGVFNFVPEWNDANRFRSLAEALNRAGWPARRIEKVLGNNLLRVYAEGWEG